MPASIAATSSRVSGLVGATPLPSPTNTGWIWRIETMGASELFVRILGECADPARGACSEHQCNSRNQQHDQYDIPECVFIEPAIELQAKPCAGEQRRQPDQEQAQGVRADHAGATEPCASHQEDRDRGRLKHRTLLVAGPAAP